MSRHRIPGLNPAHIVHVGYTSALGTFFGEVWDTGRSDEENPVIWCPNLSTLGALALAMEPYAEISHATRRLLYQDREFGR